eukprot:74791-Rhodomonas_salina.2
MGNAPGVRSCTLANEESVADSSPEGAAACARAIGAFRPSERGVGADSCTSSTSCEQHGKAQYRTPHSARIAPCRTSRSKLCAWGFGGSLPLLEEESPGCSTRCVRAKHRTARREEDSSSARSAPGRVARKKAQTWSSFLRASSYSFLSISCRLAPPRAMSALKIAQHSQG